MTRVLGAAKAVASGLIAGGASLGAALSDGGGFNSVTAGEWVATGVAFLVGLGVTYAVPNRQPAADG